MPVGSIRIVLDFCPRIFGRRFMLLLVTLQTLCVIYYFKSDSIDESGRLAGCRGQNAWRSGRHAEMTDTPRRWDRLTAESDPAFEAFAAYLETGSLRDAYRQRSGKAQATVAPGAWTGWSTKYNWVSRRAAFVEFTVRECQDATQVGLVQIRKRLIDAANALLDDGGTTAVRAASRVIVENFRPSREFPTFQTVRTSKICVISLMPISSA